MSDEPHGPAMNKATFAMGEPGAAEDLMAGLAATALLIAIAIPCFLG